jgi:hypothetical protein
VTVPICSNFAHLSRECRNSRTDWRSEVNFELPVPISEQPDDNMTSGSGAQTKCRDRPSAQTPGRLIPSASFEGDLPVVRDESCARRPNKVSTRASQHVSIKAISIVLITVPAIRDGRLKYAKSLLRRRFYVIRVPGKQVMSDARRSRGDEAGRIFSFAFFTAPPSHSFSVAVFRGHAARRV